MPTACSTTAATKASPPTPIPEPWERPWARPSCLAVSHAWESRLRPRALLHQSAPRQPVAHYIGPQRVALGVEVQPVLVEPARIGLAVGAEHRRVDVEVIHPALLRADADPRVGLADPRQLPAPRQVGLDRQVGERHLAC